MGDKFDNVLKSMFSDKTMALLQDFTAAELVELREHVGWRLFEGKSTAHLMALKCFQAETVSKRRGELLEHVLAEAFAHDWHPAEFLEYVMASELNKFNEEHKDDPLAMDDVLDAAGGRRGCFGAGYGPLVEFVAKNRDKVAPIKLFDKHGMQAVEFAEWFAQSPDEQLVVLPPDVGANVGPDIMVRLSPDLLLFVGVKQCNPDRVVETAAQKKNVLSTQVKTLFPQYDNPTKVCITAKVPRTHDLKRANAILRNHIVSTKSVVVRVQMCIPHVRTPKGGPVFEDGWSKLTSESMNDIDEKAKQRRSASGELKRCVVPELIFDCGMESIHTLLVGGDGAVLCAKGILEYYYN